MTHHCDDLIPALLRAADGTLAELPERERARLDAHLATCAACAEALADQRAMRQALGALADEAVTSHAGVRVMAELREQARTSGGFSWVDALDWRRWTWRLVPVAAALALAVANVARTDARAVETIATEAVSEALPVSSVLMTGDVTGDDLLSLLLNAGADQALGATTEGGRQ